MLAHLKDEPDRFFPAPRGSARADHDAQIAAIDRVLGRHTRLQPHLVSPEALGSFLARQPSRRRLEQHISLVLAMSAPHQTHVLGSIGPVQLRAFHALATNRPGLAAWVFA